MNHPFNYLVYGYDTRMKKKQVFFTYVGVRLASINQTISLECRFIIISRLSITSKY